MEEIIKPFSSGSIRIRGLASVKTRQRLGKILRHLTIWRFRALDWSNSPPKQSEKWQVTSLLYQMETFAYGLFPFRGPNIGGGCVCCHPIRCIPCTMLNWNGQGKGQDEFPLAYSRQIVCMCPCSASLRMGVRMERWRKAGPCPEESRKLEAFLLKESEHAKALTALADG